MTDKMREAFEKWAKSECLDTDSVDGFYSDNDTHIAWGSWQAAQSAAVPVVGDVLFYASDSTPTAESQIQYDVCAYQKDYSFFPVYRKPTTSITAAELDALRKDAERLDAAMKIMFDDWHPLSVAFGKMAKASTKDELLANLDAAIAAEGEK